MTSRNPNRIALLLADFVNERMSGGARPLGPRGLKRYQRASAKWRRGGARRDASDPQFKLRIRAPRRTSGT